MRGPGWWTLFIAEKKWDADFYLPSSPEPNQSAYSQHKSNDRCGHGWETSGGTGGAVNQSQAYAALNKVLLLVWRCDQSFKGVGVLTVSFQSWHAVTSRPGELLNHTLFQLAYFNNLYAYAIIRCSRWVPLHFLAWSCLLLWVISVLPPVQKHVWGTQSLSLPLIALWRQETCGLGKGKYWWYWTQTAMH